MKDSKNLVIGMLCAVICIMAVAYAAFSTQLSISGTASIESNWGVSIQSVECNTTPANAGAPTVDSEGNKLEATGSGSGTTGSFTIGLLTPGDSATCTVTIKNTGDLAAKVGTLEVTGADSAEALNISVSGIAEGTQLAGGKTMQYTITASYKDVTTQPTGGLTANIKVISTFVQDMGANGGTTSSTTVAGQ